MKASVLLTILALFGENLFAQHTTSFDENTGVYSSLLKNLQADMYADREMTTSKVLNGRKRDIFVPWIRDHVHVMKAMKFLHKDMTSFLEFFLENQTTEGIYFDYFFPFGEGGAGSRKKIFHPRYWKEFPAENMEMHRLPVEADLEYLMVEGVYTAWQSTGDAAFVKKWLPTLVRGMSYSMTDPLRWSTKHQLVKRGYTLDTWDFMQLPASREEFSRNGGNIQKAIFDIDPSTPMGIMHGDNSGMYSACEKLSQLFAIAGDATQAVHWREKALHFRKRTNEVCWNGKYYAHFVEDTPPPPYLKMDQRNTLSLSNPYDINRGLPDEAMAQSIIETYRTLKSSNRANSFAEWFGVYPAVEPHFAGYLPGSYMNGGVNAIVGGELAKAAFQHGYERYGADILVRMDSLMKSHGNHLPVAYTPQGKVDEGIPDNWGQAAVYSAMIEGLAGVVDRGAQFREVELSPRWLAAGKSDAAVTIAYGPTGASIHYDWKHDRNSRTIRLKARGPMSSTTVRLLMPDNAKPLNAQVNGKNLPFEVESIRESRYVVMRDVKGGDFEVLIRYWQ